VDDYLYINGGSDENFNTLGDMWRINLSYESEDAEIMERRKPKLWELVSKDTFNFGNRAGHRMV